jgi:tubulin gamma/phosphatidylglycerol phospholipase C
LIQPTYFPLCDEYLPNFPTALICVSIFTARGVLQTERSDVSFNTLIKALQGPTLGYDLIGNAHASNRLVFAWTVNKPKDMRWAIRHRVDAILTDDPAQLRQICDTWDAAEERRTRKADRFTILEHVQLVLIAILVALFGWMLKYQFPRTRRLQKRQRMAADENPAHLMPAAASGL